MALFLGFKEMGRLNHFYVYLIGKDVFFSAESDESLNRIVHQSLSVFVTSVVIKVFPTFQTVVKGFLVFFQVVVDFADYETGQIMIWLLLIFSQLFNLQ